MSLPVTTAVLEDIIGVAVNVGRTKVGGNVGGTGVGVGETGVDVDVGVGASAVWVANMSAAIFVA